MVGALTFTALCLKQEIIAAERISNWRRLDFSSKNKEWQLRCKVWSWSVSVARVKCQVIGDGGGLGSMGNGLGAIDNGQWQWGMGLGLVVDAF